MRIGVDASCWVNRRGYGRYTRELLRTLLNLDRENDYWFFLDADTARRSEDLPARAHPVIVETGRAAALAASASGHRSLRDMWAMSRSVREREGELDLFYFPSVYTFFPVRTRAKVAVTVHDTIAERYPELVFPSLRARLFWRLKVRLALRQADLVLTVSETARKDVIEEFALEGRQVKVISDAVGSMFRPLEDGPETARALGKFGLADGERFVLYVGGISPHKNLSTLLASYSSLLREPDLADVKLVLAGDFEGDVFYSAYPSLREKVEGEGMSSRVIFTSFVSDVDLLHLYNAASVLVMPSFLEGFGLPALEAMACGTPVIASRAGALPEVTGDAARLFDPSDPGELTGHLGEVLKDESLREDMVRRGRRRARELSWERSAEVALATFRGLVEGP